MLTRSTSSRSTSSCQSPATCGMPNSSATTAARSRWPLAIATTFAPMQSRKPGIWVVRANPVPTIPIPTGAFFMATYFTEFCVSFANVFFEKLTLAAGEFGDHGY
jgi:hypothetical protein